MDSCGRFSGSLRATFSLKQENKNSEDEITAFMANYPHFTINRVIGCDLENLKTLISDGQQVMVTYDENNNGTDIIFLKQVSDLANITSLVIDDDISNIKIEIPTAPTCEDLEYVNIKYLSEVNDVHRINESLLFSRSLVGLSGDIYDGADNEERCSVNIDLLNQVLAMPDISITFTVDGDTGLL